MTARKPPPDRAAARRPAAPAIALALGMAAGIGLAPVPASAESAGPGLPTLTRPAPEAGPPVKRPHRPHRNRYWKGGRYVIFADRLDPYDPGERLPRPVEVGPPEPPEPREPETTAEPVPAPDPGSPRRALPARGTAAQGTAAVLGEPLPRRLPQVILSWRSYDLPEPPPGEIYVRVGREVVRIDQTDRRVLAIYDPRSGTMIGPADPG